MSASFLATWRQAPNLYQEARMGNRSPLVVFSHLRWNFVYQRPQHVLSRLAGHRPVLFIEEPINNPEVTSPRWAKSYPANGLTVYVPQLPANDQNLGFQSPSLKTMLRHFAATEIGRKPLAWTYTPSAVDLIADLDPSLVIYDCMDELSAFLNAPQELRLQEERLLSIANLVFTGGPSLYRAKKDRHPEVYCFASSVDVEHFRPKQAISEDAKDQDRIPGPRLGFFGVIDERLDVNLIRHMAEQRPDWQIILVGPVVKIDPAILPKLPNIHYMGGRDYKQLPAYIQGWDVCLMPFAMNEATRFISPTKVLEYMAADKPIVSTPITDVVEPYGHFVRIGTTPESFVQMCDEALNASEADIRGRHEAAEAVLSKTSWSRTAEAMEALIEKSMEGKQPALAKMQNESPIVVAGAGPTGLSAAYHLGEKALLIEQQDRVGGWCRSIENEGFTFDFAGHIMFSAEPYVHQMYKMLLGENVHWQDREAWVYSYNVFTRYPFQGALYGLPPEVIQECIVGAIESRYGTIGTAPSKQANGAANGTNGSPSQMEKNGTCIKDCCADGLIEASTPVVTAKTGDVAVNAEPKNFEEFIYRVWGAGIAKHFAVPYNKKLWAVPLSEMETSWLGGRVPMPDLSEMIEGALKPKAKPMGPNARFGYPLHGGFQALMDGFLPHMKGPMLLGTSITSVDVKQRKLSLSDGSEVKYQHLISTMPLPVLIRMMGDGAPQDIQDAASKLRNVSVRCINIGVGRERLTDKHWIYYPGDTVFHRVFVQGNASPHCNAPGGFGLTCEITYSEHKPLPCDGDELVQLAIKDCIRVGLFNEEDPIWTSFSVDMPYAYVVYDHQRKQAVEHIREWLAQQDITLAGRYSEWEYYNSDHAFVAGKNAAESAQAHVAKVLSKPSNQVYNQSTAAAMQNPS